MFTFLKNKIKTFFKQVFCNHHYSFIGSIPYFYYYDEARTQKHDCSVDFFECTICNKRKFISTEENHVYKNKVWKELKMWEKHEIDINFLEKKEAQN